MQITVVALLCHSLGALPAVCREEIVTRTDTMQSCMLGQAAIADWKMHSLFRGEAWRVMRIKCVPGDYQIKDAI